jgi:hypothetical protein
VDCPCDWGQFDRRPGPPGHADSITCGACGRSPLDFASKEGQAKIKAAVDEHLKKIASPRPGEAFAAGRFNPAEELVLGRGIVVGLAVDALARDHAAGLMGTPLPLRGVLTPDAAQALSDLATLQGCTESEALLAAVGAFEKARWPDLFGPAPPQEDPVVPLPGWRPFWRRQPKHRRRTNAVLETLRDPSFGLPAELRERPIMACPDQTPHGGHLWATKGSTELTMWCFGVVSRTAPLTQSEPNLLPKPNHFHDGRPCYLTGDH